MFSIKDFIQHDETVANGLFEENLQEQTDNCYGIEKYLYEANENVINVKNEIANVLKINNINFTVKGNTFKIPTSESRAVFNKKLEEMLNKAKLKDNEKVLHFTYDVTKTTQSSAGAVITHLNGNKSIQIVSKPLISKKTGTKTAGGPGVENEMMLVNTIKNLTYYGTPEAHPITIKFKGNNKSVEYKNIVDAIHVGGDTKGRKKADVLLIDKTGKRFPISLKMANAGKWESSDTLFGKYMRDVFERLDMLGKVDYKKELWNGGGYNYTLIKSEFKIQVKDPETIKNVCFGTDILENSGCIIQNTFKSDSFKPITGGAVPHYLCNVKYIANAVKDIIEDKEHALYILCRNNKGRANSSMGYRGFRVEVIMGSERKNAPLIDPDTLPSKSKLERAMIRSMSESTE